MANYTTMVEIFEESVCGEYMGDPHVYRKTAETLDEARDVKELLWMAAEIEGLDDSVCHVDVEIFDNDKKVVEESKLRVAAEIVRTDVPSPYVIWGDKTPHIFQIDREKSSLSISAA